MNWDWSIFWRYRDAFLYGAFMTIALSILVVLFGTILGATLAFARRSHNPVLRVLAILYVWSVRIMPPLVMIYWVYYGVPFWTAFTSGVAALALNLAAFASENIRAGLEAVPGEYIDEASMAGATKWQTIWYVILPLSKRNILPNLIGEWITSIKLTSLASVIGVRELMNQAASINAETFRPMEVFTVLTVYYFLIISPLDFFGKYLERKWSERDG
jgi:polar amino acid transport system permease protein